MVLSTSVIPTLLFAQQPSPVSVEAQGYLYRLFKRLGATDFGARTGEFLLVGPLRIAAITTAAVIASRVGARVLRRAVAALRSRAPMRIRSARTDQRAATMGDAVASFWRVVVLVVASLLILGEVGINLGPLLAGAGIAGIALAFGAQAIIKDYLSGLFILLEDQYGVGDVVTIGTASGTVEDLNLRFTRLRSADGTVWFVPNGEIRTVGNQSMEWSRAIVDVVVGYDNDINAVMAALADELGALTNDPLWRDRILETPEVQGVQSMTVDGVAVRIVAKTEPRAQWAVARELRGRITERMRRDGVKGAGRMVVVTSSTLDLGVPPPAPAAQPI
jgi:moderate conductance mechanosensitive channel